MAFVFRFETVAKVRKIRQDLALQDFSKAQRHVLELEGLRESRISQKETAGRELMLRMETGIPAQDVISYDRFMTFLEKVIELLEKQIIQARKMLEEKRDALIRAKRESEAIERLRELDMERYRMQQSRQELRFIDEIAVQRHGRRT